MTGASGAGKRGGGSAGAVPELVPGLWWRRVVPGEERQCGVMRRWVESLLPPCRARNDVAVVASELVGNAVRHTASGRGGLVAVEIGWHRQVVRVAVADSGAPTEPHVIEDPAGEYGRGLLLVRGLSVRTGVCGDQRGRLVWADVAWSAPAEMEEPMRDGYEAAIREGEMALARRFAGVPAWFGRSTLAWWAMPGPGALVTAPSARELAGVLYRLLDASPTPETVASPQEQPRLREQGTAESAHGGRITRGVQDRPAVRVIGPRSAQQRGSRPLAAALAGAGC